MVTRFGRELIDDPLRCEGLLRDLCGEQRREIFVLLAALKERVVADLVAPQMEHVPRHLLLGQLTRRLAENLALAEDAARWGVESWAVALGVIRAEEAGAPAVPAAEESSPAGPPPPRRKTLTLEINSPPEESTARPSSRTPRSLVVSKLGRGDFTSISRAVENARPGDRILVEPGLYAEGLILDRPVEIIGDGPRAEIVVDSSDADCVAMFTDYAMVRNLTLRGRAGTKSKQFFAVDVARGRLVLEECDITSDSLACVAIHGGESSPILRRCVIHDGRQAGIMVYQGGEGTIEDCDLAANSVGVAVAGKGMPTLRRCQIHDGKTGLYVYDGGLGLLEECSLFGHSASEVQIRQGGSPVLRGCKIRDALGFGLYIHENGECLFEDGDIFSCGGSSAVVFQGGSLTLRRSRLRDGQAEGVYVFENGRALIEECDIFAQRNACVIALQGGQTTLRGCRVHDGESVGLFFSERGGGRLEDCDIFHHSDAGVVIEQEADPVLSRCRIHDGKSLGLLVRTQGRGTIESCDIHHHPLAGVRIAGAGFPLLRRCLVHDQRERGILVEETGQGLIDDCEIFANAGDGVEIASGGDPVVRGTRVVRNQGAGVRVHSGGAGTIEGCDLSLNGRGPWDIADGCRVKRKDNHSGGTKP